MGVPKQELALTSTWAGDPERCRKDRENKTLKPERGGAYAIPEGAQEDRPQQLV